MKVLMIGGTGNLSADCAEALHRRGHEILVVTRGGTPLPEAFRPVVADRRDARAFGLALAGLQPQVVLNFLGFDLDDVRIDHALFQDSLEQYVFISSATVYAKPHQQMPLTEEAPVGNRFWDYARKKQACEEWLMARYREEGFPVTIVRPSHTYSHRWVPNPVSSGSYTFAARLERGCPVFVPDEGQSLWTLTAACDFASGLAGLVGRKEAVGETFHITSDEALTWNRIVEEIGAALGVETPCVLGIPTDFVCRVAPQLAGPWKGDKANPAVFDNAKIRRFVPDFVCRKTFRVGVRESVAWLRAHPERQNLRPSIDALCEEVVAAWQGQTLN